MEKAKESRGEIIIAFGVDIARAGDDKNVICVRDGDNVVDLISFSSGDLMETVTRIVHMAKRYHPEVIVLDVNGVGAGVYDRLRELDHVVLPFVAQESTDETDSSGELQFANRRSFAWWSLRERLAPHNGYKVALPRDDELLSDLAAPQYKQMDGSGRIKIESKDDIKKRLKRSPDKGDAVVMCFYEGECSAYEDSFRAYTPSFLQNEERRREQETHGDVSDEERLLRMMLEGAEKRRGKLPWDL